VPILFVFLALAVAATGHGGGEIRPLITWVTFGAAVVGQSIDAFSWQIVLYAVLSLTIVRMLPVFLVLQGMNLRAEENCSWSGSGHADWPASCLP